MAKSSKKTDDIEDKDAEIARLQERLSFYEPPPPPPVEYPKWVKAKDGSSCIVPDRETEDAVVAGDVAPQPRIKGATSEVVEPSVKKS